jgi:hypothetical protein
LFKFLWTEFLLTYPEASAIDVNTDPVKFETGFSAAATPAAAVSL